MPAGEEGIHIRARESVCVCVGGRGEGGRDGGEVKGRKRSRWEEVR